MMDLDELDRRFDYHPADTEGRAAQHALVRAYVRSLADTLNDVLPDGREKSIVITKLEEALFWANAAIARSPREQLP